MLDRPKRPTPTAATEVANMARLACGRVVNVCRRHVDAVASWGVLIAALVTLVRQTRGHSSLLVPPSRNSIDKTLAPWRNGSWGDGAFGPDDFGCNCVNATSDGQVRSAAEPCLCVLSVWPTSSVQSRHHVIPVIHIRSENIQQLLNNMHDVGTCARLNRPSRAPICRPHAHTD